MKTKTALLSVALLCSLCASSVFAQDEKNAVRVGASYFVPTADSVFLIAAVELDEAFGFGVGYTRRVSDRFSVDFDVHHFRTRPKVSVFGFGAEGEKTRVMPVTLAANYHFTPGRKVDFYAGPMLAFVEYGDYDDDLTWGANIGFDVPVTGSKWSFFTNLKYIRTEAAGLDDTVSEEDPDLFGADVNPFILSIGAAYRF